MRNLIVTAQLIVLTVIAISLMREFKHAEAGRDARLKLLQSLSAPVEQQPDCVIFPPHPSAPIT